jgi:hypothetical protein
MIVFISVNTKFYFFISLYSVICILSSSVFTNAAFGLQQSVGPSIGLQQSTVPKMHLVKITSPIKGEQVPVGKDLPISGTSVDNGTSGCKVSVKVNFVNPYHDALPIAEGGQNNSYSKWNFTLTPAYTSIHPGQNKIIAKFSCADNPNLVSKATVNVTGVGSTIPIVATDNGSKENNNNTQQQLSSIAATPPPQSTSDTITDAVGAPPVAGNENTDPKTLSASIHFGKNSIHSGDTQSITVRVSDKNSANTISGASITGKITGPSSGILKKLEGTTDNKGIDTYSWKTSNDYTSGKYELKVDVSYQGYSEYSTSKTFKVIPLPVTDTGSTSYKVIPYFSSNIISSYPYSDTKHYGTNTNINTNSYTNTKHYHHSKIISSYPYNSDTNTGHTDITTGSKGPGMSNLAQKIINDVKSKFKSNWIQLP